MRVDTEPTNLTVMIMFASYHEDSSFSEDILLSSWQRTRKGKKQNLLTLDSAASSSEMIPLAGRRGDWAESRFRLYAMLPPRSLLLQALSFNCSCLLGSATALSLPPLWDCAAALA